MTRQEMPDDEPFYDLIVIFNWINWIKMNVNARNRVRKPFNESKLKKACCGLLGPIRVQFDPETSFHDNRDLDFNFSQCHSNRGAISSKNDIFEFWAQRPNPAHFHGPDKVQSPKA